MDCPYCGAENPDHMIYCGKCAGRIRESEPSTSSLGASLDSEKPPWRTTPRKSKLLGSSPFSRATLASAAGLVLLVAGLVLYIYYAERWISLMRGRYNSDEMVSLANIAEVSDYATDLGIIVAILGFIFIIQGVIHWQKDRAGSAMLSRIRLTNVKWLLLLAIALMIVATLVKVWLYEVDSGLGYDMWMRIHYLTMCDCVFLAAAFLLIAVESRKATEAEP
jgi:hypothetical protein